jgi:hypothetical protein
MFGDGGGSVSVPKLTPEAKPISKEEERRKEEEKKKLKKKPSTILTSPSGLMDEAAIRLKRLLGQ